MTKSLRIAWYRSSVVAALWALAVGAVDAGTFHDVKEQSSRRARSLIAADAVPWMPQAGSAQRWAGTNPNHATTADPSRMSRFLPGVRIGAAMEAQFPQNTSPRWEGQPNGPTAPVYGLPLTDCSGATIALPVSSSPTNTTDMMALGLSPEEPDNSSSGKVIRTNEEELSRDFTGPVGPNEASGLLLETDAKGYDDPTSKYWALRAAKNQGFTLTILDDQFSMVMGLLFGGGLAALWRIRRRQATKTTRVSR